MFSSTLLLLLRIRFNHTCGPLSERVFFSTQDANDDIIVEAVEEEFVASGSSHTAAQEDAAVDDISALKARREELSKKLAEQVEYLRGRGLRTLMIQ
jgi:hypothetical protein